MFWEVVEEIFVAFESRRDFPQGLKPRIDSMDIVPGIKSPAYRPNEFFRKL